MGHYASEMHAPMRHEPEVIADRQQEARDRAEFRWDLYRQYEDAGCWIDDRETLTCPQCFAAVPALLRSSHDGWHAAVVR